MASTPIPERPTAPAERPSSVTPAVRAASDWAWRLLAIAGAVIALAYLLGFISEAVIPIVVAVLLAALLHPINRWLRARLRRAGAAAGLTVLATVIAIGLLLLLVGSQITGGFPEMAGQVGAGIGKIKAWLQTTFQISDSQFTEYLDDAKSALSTSEGLRGALTRAGLGASHVVAGLFISLFALFFFLYEGDRIWGWVVRLFPRAARARVDSSGHVAWEQLTAFTRATILVALVDAAGITLVALVLRVPFPLAIGALVFLGAFIPIVGALFSGMIAVLLALVAHGPVVALLMLAGVIAVQQLESHVLQPFLLGRAVSVHPLAIILAIAVGVVVAGVVGALVAVPLAAVLNAVVKHLVAGGEDPQPTLASPDSTGTGTGVIPEPPG
ncbi:MAG: AI-2E family transporter [Candidatus Phosphoribacter sp.]